MYKLPLFISRVGRDRSWKNFHISILAIDHGVVEYNIFFIIYISIIVLNIYILYIINQCITIMFLMSYKITRSGIYSGILDQGWFHSQILIWFQNYSVWLEKPLDVHASTPHDGHTP